MALSEDFSRKLTFTPAFTPLASSSASQLVRRTQPCEETLPTSRGSGVPWMP